MSHGTLPAALSGPSGMLAAVAALPDLDGLPAGCGIGSVADVPVDASAPSRTQWMVPCCRTASSSPESSPARLTTPAATAATASTPSRRRAATSTPDATLPAGDVLADTARVRLDIEGGGRTEAFAEQGIGVAH